MIPWKSSNIYKNVERERLNFAVCGVEFQGEKLPTEEGMKLYGMGIEKECSLRRKLNVVAVWLSPKARKTLSFEQVKQILDGESE